MSVKNKSKSHGPGNSFYYISDDGDLCFCKWNDAGWCTTTHKKADEIKGHELLSLLETAYQNGLADQKQRTKNVLGI